MAAVKIGTHNGAFHADEVLGCFMLKQLPEYRDAEIIRTRDPKVLETCDILLDVGAVYSHYRLKYDHHQREFCETMETITGLKHHIKLSSAGLVYAHYGKEVISSILRRKLEKDGLELVFNQVYINFLKEIDAKDNGIEQCDHTLRYHIYTDISSRVKRLNVFDANIEDCEEAQFKLAFELVGQEFTKCVLLIANEWLPARKVVIESAKNRYKVDKSGRIMEFKDAGVPWISHLKSVELDELKGKPMVYFVIFPDRSGSWRVQGVPKDDGFEVRHKVLPQLTGIRDELLVMASAVDDAIFVHASGFIGGAKSREGALKMARKSIPKEENE